MAAIGNEPERSLVNVFAEFSLLPDLLAKVLPGQRDRTLGRWHEFFLDIGVNTDHVEDEDIPDGLDEDGFMVADVWLLCDRFGLILPNCQLSFAELPVKYRGTVTGATV